MQTLLDLIFNFQKYKRDLEIKAILFLAGNISGAIVVYYILNFTK